MATMTSSFYPAIVVTPSSCPSEDLHKTTIDRAEERSEASTDIGKCSDPCVSEVASSRGGDASPRSSMIAIGTQKPMIPRGPRWSDLSDGLLDDDDDDNCMMADSLDASPKSPSKSSRRANRRRRRREEAKAAIAFSAASTEQQRDLGLDNIEYKNKHSTSSSQAVGSKLMLPAAACVDAAARPSHHVGICTPICTASPSKSSGGGVLSSAASLPRSYGNFGVSGSCCVSNPSSPCRRVVRDASSRIPTQGTGTGAACPSPSMRGLLGTSDASTRTPVVGAHHAVCSTPGHAGVWAAVAPDGSTWNILGGSPMGSNMHGGFAVPGVMCTSPMAVGSASPIPMMCTSPVAMMCASPVAMTGPAAPFPTSTASPSGPAAGSATSDALRTLLGTGDLPTGLDLEERLRAAAPEAYED